MRAEILAIGDELITGQRLDTNTQWLSERLTELGVDVAFHTTVGDDLADNVAVFAAAIERADVVVTTGGLGPTADDLTREALAQATGRQLVRDDRALAHIEQLFASRGREMPERNRVQADFPEGSSVIDNEHGTAPGIDLSVERPGRIPCAVFALPGVPAELKPMWFAHVAPAIQRFQPEGRVIRHRRIKCFGVGESTLEAMLPDLIRRGREPRVGITVSDATITLRVTASGPDEAACFAAMLPTEEVIRDKLGDLVFGEEEQELEDVVVAMLAERGLTLAVAEWATGGQLAHCIAALESPATVLKGSIVIVDRDQLTTYLGVQAGGHEPHSAAVASMLAERARDQTRADVGLAVGAYPANPYVADARVHVAIAAAEKTYKQRFGCASHPAILHTRTVKQALNALRLVLLRKLETE